MINMNIKSINEWSILSIILILAGILFYIFWGITYNVWMDIGIYSITIIITFSGICGFLLSIMIVKEETDQ